GQLTATQAQIGGVTGVVILGTCKGTTTATCTGTTIGTGTTSGIGAGTGTGTGTGCVPVGQGPLLLGAVGTSPTSHGGTGLLYG
ncbi:hypothetical protein KI387_003980, partial [Taxus chinensis]